MPNRFYRRPKEKIHGRPKKVLRDATRRKIGKWSRKGMPKRTKGMWHIPKRSSFDQIEGVIRTLVDLDLNYKSWNRINQEKVNRELARRNLTQSGIMLTPSAFGTLIALVKYFGYIHKKDEKIIITKAGIAFESNPKAQFKDQILKLQITNPLILKYCENIFIFPFKEILKLLLELDYLTTDEMAYVVFKDFKKEEDFKAIIKKILKFRSLSEKEKGELIEKFKKTPEGNVALAKAPSASYFISFLLHTGLCYKKKINGKPAIKIKNKNETKSLLNKYVEAKTFNFKDNLDLWIKYIGEPDRLHPPREKIIKFKDPAQKDKLILISQNNEQINADVINAVSEIRVPLFDNEKYLITVFELKNGSNIGSFEILTTKDKKELMIDLKDIEPPKALTAEDWVELIKEHIESRDFDSVYKYYLNTLRKILDIKRRDGRLRGGRFEFLFYKFLEQFKKKGLIKELKWNGTLGKYGINEPARGGKQGFPDITFRFDKIHFILELTTIKSRSTQWSAEGSSVPDHIRNILRENKKGRIIGIFCAPIQFSRNIRALKSSLVDKKIPILCYEVDSLISIFFSKDPLERFLEDIKQTSLS